MNREEWERCYARGLAFFGRISANVSHEIKNHLAVINELGGLLQDLSVMAQKKGDLDPDRVERLAGNITGQITQSDKIIRAFNYFSHSVDRTQASIDLDEFAEIMVTITRRLAAVKGMELVYNSEKRQHAPIYTNPFLLEQLYHLCLEHIIARGKAGLIISIRISRNSANGKLIFSCTEPVIGDIPEDDYLDLLNRELNASIQCEPDGKELVLTIEQLAIQPLS